MKALLNMFALTAGFLLAGCVTSRNGLVLETVGPSLAAPASASLSSTEGALVVYSAFRRNADFDARDPYHPEYSDYDVCTADGKLLRKVHNNSGTILQEAVSVALPPGQYRITARANGYGFVTVPVVIEARRSTVLHLEGGGSWPDEFGFDKTNTVCLPDGQVVGWKASTHS